MSNTFDAVTNRMPMNHDHQVQPVRRNSKLRGHCEAGFWRAVSKREGWSLVVLAKRYEKLRKEAGKKNGPLGIVAIEVLEYMVNLIDHKTGRLEPSIATLMQKLNRSRDAIWKALNALRQHGFIDWLRRYVPTNREGSGPQVQQTSNAYRLMRPQQAEHAVDGGSSPLPLDQEQAEQEKAITRAEHDVQEIGGRLVIERMAEAQSTTGEWARWLLRLLDLRESVHRTESHIPYFFS